MLRHIALLCVTFLFSLPQLVSKTLADETYAKEVQKATGVGNKAYRKKGGKDVKKPSASSGERRFKEENSHKEEKTVTSADSDAMVGEDAVIPEQIFPLVNEENKDFLKFQKPEFQEWEIRPMTLDEKALTDAEIQMVKDHYQESEKNNGRPHLQMISNPK